MPNNITKHVDLSVVETYQKDVFFTQLTPKELEAMVDGPTAKKFISMSMHGNKRIAVSSIYSFGEADALDKFKLFLVKDLPNNLQEKCRELIEKYEQPEWKESKRKLTMAQIDKIIDKWIKEQEESITAQEHNRVMAEAILKARQSVMDKKIPDEFKGKELSGEEVHRVLDAREKQEKVKKE